MLWKFWGFGLAWISCFCELNVCVLSAPPPPCASLIYCSGEILQQVQRARLFEDDKHFVDMKLKQYPDKILEAFRNLTAEVIGGDLTPEQLRGFVSSNFEGPGQEFEPWTPGDWQDQPRILEKISDNKLRVWAVQLHNLWKSLGRKIREDVKSRSELHSQIYIPHPVVVPGGRFREFYYWDSYWVINGLLISDMPNTAKGMIQNYFYLLERYGFVPNGGRIYYERRSQPPFLTLMVESYFNKTTDSEFLRTNIHLLEKEYEFWMRNRTVMVSVAGRDYTLNRYVVDVGDPRPESYSADWELAKDLLEADRQELWAELKSAAESGWDFSSRWFINSSGENSGSLSDTKTRQVVPVDLNAVLCRCEHALAHFYRVLDNIPKAEGYEKALKERKSAVQAVLWDEAWGSWFDYNLVKTRRNVRFYASNLSPLWAECFPGDQMVTEKVIQYLKSEKVLNYRNGIPTSLSESGQQWDFPNAWPPLQQMIIEGLAKTDSVEAGRIAFDLAQKWIQANWAAYGKYQAMFEKYDVTGDGKPGGGGEYEVQLGFGWTNGVALQLLDQFGDRLTVESAAPASACTTVLLLTCGLAAFYSLL
ncbi:trehalase isoform X1 [Latimeria chalumnae]|nr:PREDICTED: trehalase isoform X1 [Latimeria chalumnae]|eukprot:XP_005988172.1 PREDICTED: trehalase isoform X1 [Latimeria chalumnae]